MKNGHCAEGFDSAHHHFAGRACCSEESLTWLTKEVSSDVNLSLMAQYYPAHNAARFPALVPRDHRSGIQWSRGLYWTNWGRNGLDTEMSAPDNWPAGFWSGKSSIRRPLGLWPRVRFLREMKFYLIIVLFSSKSCCDNFFTFSAYVKNAPSLALPQGGKRILLLSRGLNTPLEHPQGIYRICGL